MKALVLVDIQNDFMPWGAVPVPHGDEVVPVANQVIPAFDLVVATQDWHPANHGSFASQHPGKVVGDVVILDGLAQTLWPDHCIQNTPGADFPASLNVAGVHRLFRKGADPAVDSYSGFFDNGHRKATGLGDYLKKRGVHELHIMGLAMDYCVKFTALDAREQGFETRLIVEGVRGVELQEGDCLRAREQMQAAGVQLVSAIAG
jgi:nicotinamidase/pyrazinamidase